MSGKVSSGCLWHHPVTGQLSSLLLTILGWRRLGKIGSANTEPHDESRGVCVSINPRPCHSEPVTDVTGVGIRDLLAGNLRNSAGIMRFGNGLPRQSADWLAMTGFFDRLTPRRKSRGFVVSGKVSSGCLRHHPVTGQLSSLLLTILGWRRPGKIGSANTKPRDESRGALLCRKK